MTADASDIEARRRRAVFRASHRGTREMDWLLGRFAEARVSEMDLHELTDFEALLALPDPDIERWLLLGARPLPEGSLGEVVEQVLRFHKIGG